MGIFAGSLESDTAFLPGRRRDSNDSNASVPILPIPSELEKWFPVKMEFFRGQLIPELVDHPDGMYVIFG